MRINPPNFFWIEKNLETDIANYLWSQIDAANFSVKNELVGHISNSFSLPDTEGIFKRYMFNQCQDLSFIDSHFQAMNTWVNFQKKYEFNPNHTHGGRISFVIWMKIPYNYEDEKKTDLTKGVNAQCRSGCFELVYCDIFGRPNTYLYPLSTDLEGKMLIFPAELWHIVYPFYTSDEQRISISGNII